MIFCCHEKKNATSPCRRPRRKKSSWRQFGISDALQKLWETGEEIELQLQRPKQTICESLAVFAEVLRRFLCFLHLVQWFFRFFRLHVENAFEFLRMKFFQATKAEKTNELTTKKIDLKDAEKAVRRKALRNSLKVRVWIFGMANIFWIFAWLSQTLVIFFLGGKSFVQGIESRQGVLRGSWVQVALGSQNLTNAYYDTQYSISEKNQAQKKVEMVEWDFEMEKYFMFCYILLCMEVDPCELESEELKPECLKPPMTREEKMEKRKQDKQGQPMTTTDVSRKHPGSQLFWIFFLCFFVVGFSKVFQDTKLNSAMQPVFFTSKKKPTLPGDRIIEGCVGSATRHKLRMRSWISLVYSQWQEKKMASLMQSSVVRILGLLFFIPESNIECAISVWEGSHVFELGAAGVRLKC